MPSNNVPCSFQDEVEIVNGRHTVITLSKNTCSMYGHIPPSNKKQPQTLHNGFVSEFRNLIYGHYEDYYNHDFIPTTVIVQKKM